MLLGFGWFLHSSSSRWLLWARNQPSPGVWLYPDPGHRLLSLSVIWWVRLFRGVAETTLIGVHGFSQASCFLEQSNVQKQTVPRQWVSLSGF